MKKAKIVHAGSPDKAIAPSFPVRKHSNSDKPDKVSQNKLTKGYPLSKSQDNLASQLRRKAAAAAKEASNKENGFKVPGMKSSKITKSTSVDAKSESNKIDPLDTPIKRAQSAQNITKAQPAPNKSESVKKASSTQNLTKGGMRQMRISAPVNIMAYNAELLASFEKEKKTMEKRISELIQIAEMRKTEIEKHKYEIINLKEQLPSESIKEEIDMLRHENTLLKDRLTELGVPVEHITDSEKLLLKKSSSVENSGEYRGSYTYESISLPGFKARTDSFEGNIDARSAASEFGLSSSDLHCITPDHPSSLALSFDNGNWDRLSNKSSDALSEVSVACLQDRILQMEETHYSTNEELQATLQELTDLQDNVNELTGENERLADERSVLLESLCAQTEKLENGRMQIEHLKALLLSECDDRDRSENERQLVALVKSAQVEREELLLKQIELNNTLVNTENEQRELQDIVTALRDKTHILEMKYESLVSDKHSLESQINELKEANSSDQIEISKLQTLYETEKNKVGDLEQCRNAIHKSELEELLDNTRQEKDKVEERLTNTCEELAITQNDVTRLKEQIATSNEELKVAKNNAKTQVSDVEYKMSQITKEKKNMIEEINTLRDHIDQLQMDCDRYLDDKKTYHTSLSDLESELRSSKLKLVELESNLKEAKNRFREEQEEWKQFQADLQTAVVIANDMKTETSEELEALFKHNFDLKDKNQLLYNKIEDLNSEISKLKHMQDITPKSDIRTRVELVSLRSSRKLSDTFNNQGLSVKNLIASIEEQVKSPSSDGDSRRNSIESPSSISSFRSDSPPKCETPTRRSSMPAESHSHLKSVLKKPDLKENRLSLNTSYRSDINTVMYNSPKVEPKASSPINQNDIMDISKQSIKSVLKKNSCSEESNRSEKTSYIIHGVHGAKSDPLSHLAKLYGGSKRNALLKWCQSKSVNYSGIDITNFSSSWNDGLSFCCLMHNYLPEKVPYHELNSQDKKKNFTIAFKAAESVGIVSILNINDMVSMERPDWSQIMAYVTSIYKHFELDNK